MFHDQKPRRSKAWVYYSLLAVLALVLIPSVGLSMLLIAAVCGSYATYLFRGGRIVVWMW
jgi:hypothetical protein